MAPSMSQNYESLPETLGPRQPCPTPNATMDSEMRPILDPADALWPGPAIEIDSEIARIVQTRAEDPVFATADPAALRARLSPSLPREGAPLPDVLEEIRAVVHPHVRRNGHPGMFGYVSGSGLPTDPLAHAMVAALGQNVTGFPSAPGATTVERLLIDWLIELAGLPAATAGGALVSGGSAANLTGLTVALHHDRPREGGLRRGPLPVVYTTRAAHFSIARALRLTGLGTDALRFVDVDETGKMVPAALVRAIRADRESGRLPAVVCASAGATTTGVVDPLAAIAGVCATHGLWFHVDAAYGGGALLHAPSRSRLAGIERADSVGLDLHKWMYTTFDCSAILYRDERTAKRTFYETSEYFDIPEQAPPEQFVFFHYTAETSRRFRALAPYLALRHYGIERLGRNVAHNIACAEYLGARITAMDDVELAAPVGLSIVCFRVRPPVLSDAEVDALNAAIQRELVERGRFFLSPTTLHGRAVLRVCMISPQTTADTIDELLEAVISVGKIANCEGRIMKESFSPKAMERKAADNAVQIKETQIKKRAHEMVVVGDIIEGEEKKEEEEEVKLAFVPSSDHADQPVEADLEEESVEEEFEEELSDKSDYERSDFEESSDDVSSKRAWPPWVAIDAPGIHEGRKYVDVVRTKA